MTQHRGPSQSYRNLECENRRLRDVAVAALALVTSPWPPGSVERQPAEETLRAKLADWRGGPVESGWGSGAERER